MKNLPIPEIVIFAYATKGEALKSPTKPSTKPVSRRFTS